MSRTPSTEAGRRLLATEVTETLDGRYEVPADFLTGLPAAVLAVESEARQQGRPTAEELAEAMQQAYAEYKGGRIRFPGIHNYRDEAVAILAALGAGPQVRGGG